MEIVPTTVLGVTKNTTTLRQVKLRKKATTKPDATGKNRSGKITSLKARKVFDPKLAAASSRDVLICFNPAVAAA